MSRDSAYIELRNLEAEMENISPKLSIFKKMEEKRNFLLEELGGNRINKTKYGPNRKKKIKEKKGTSEAS
jgi:predicted DNA-binding protein YlxM (UPF0122 family)